MKVRVERPRMARIRLTPNQIAAIEGRPLELPEYQELRAALERGNWRRLTFAARRRSALEAVLLEAADAEDAFAHDAPHEPADLRRHARRASRALLAVARRVNAWEGN